MTIVPLQFNVGFIAIVSAMESRSVSLSSYSGEWEVLELRFERES
jgi:hypothetical protein